MRKSIQSQIIESFNKGVYNYLFTTDLAFMGLDLSDFTITINCEIPLNYYSNYGQFPVKPENIDIKKKIQRIRLADAPKKMGLALTVSTKNGEQGISEAVNNIGSTIKTYVNFQDIEADLMECYCNNAI